MERRGAMSRPRKHPSSGVYWLRKEGLRALVGKREESERVEAKRPTLKLSTKSSPCVYRKSCPDLSNDRMRALICFVLAGLAVQVEEPA